MRPLHGLVLLLALALLLVGGLIWLGGKHSGGTLAQPVAEAPEAPHALAPEAQLSASGEEGAHVDRAAQPAALVMKGSAGAEKGESAGLFGRVIGPDGQPVAGAKVYAGPGEGPAFMPLDAIDPKTMPWARRSDAVTDAQGKFQLDLSGETHVRLAVRAGGFAPLDDARTLARGERNLGDVALELGVVLEGRVIDQLGRPVAEAQLFSRPRDSGFRFEMPNRGRAPLATTDAQGHFRVDMLASGPWRMLVNSEEHPDKTFDGQTERPGSVAGNLEFALEEGAQISGRVTGAGPELLAKLQVSAQQRAENEDDNGGMVMSFGSDDFVLPRRGKVGADGSFVVRGLKPGQTYRLQPQKADSGGFGFGMGSRKGTSAKSGDRGIEVPYTASGAIVCHVVDASSGQPVTDLDVKAGYSWSIPLIGPDGKPVGKFPEGKVRFDRLPPRMDFGGGNKDGLKLRIDATGYKSYESAALTVVDGQDLDLGVVRLERAPVCRVQVLDLASGAPLAGAEVSLREEGAEASGLGRMAFRAGRGGRTVNDQGLSQGTTGADGNVVLSSFPGKQATLQVKHADYAAWKSAPLTLSATGDHQETVKLARGGDVLVHVVDSKGKPVASVEIEHSAASGEEENAFVQRMSGGGPTRTDARGELLFPHLEAGSHRFRISSGGGMHIFGAGGGAAQATIAIAGEDSAESQEEPWSSVDVVEGGQASLKLVAPARTSVVGRVREGGTPLVGASVHFQEKRANQGGFPGMPFFGGQEGPRTNGSGEYKAEGLKPGRYTVQISHPGRAMDWEGELDVREEETRYDVELPIAVVEGRVTAPDGKPIAGARVSAERAQSGQSQDRQMVVSMVVASNDGGDAFSFGGSAGAEPVRTDADGRYTLRGLLTDTDLVVHVQGKDFSPTNSAKFRVAPDQTLRGIDIQAKQGANLDVHVTRAGQPARNVLVNAYHTGKDGNQDQQSEMTGPGGVAHFTGLEPGDWEYSVTDITGEAAPDANSSPTESPRKPVVLKPGETAKADSELH